MPDLNTYKKLQDALWLIVTPNNNPQPDIERKQECYDLIMKFILSEPAGTFCKTVKTIHKCPEENNRCSSCEFWSAHRRSGTCSQKVQLPMGKLDIQFTPETYGCTTYEKRGTVDYTL